LCTPSVWQLRTAEFIDLEHDDHANISTIKKEEADIFADLLNKKGSLEGVVKNIFLPYEARGSLKFDLGEAVVCDTRRNLIAEAQLLKSYDKQQTQGDEIRYVHRVKKDVIIFRRNSLRYRDPWYHLEISRADAKELVMSLDFYDPAPVEPVPKENAAAVWSKIYIAERFHLTVNHLKVKDMLRMIESPDYIGRVDADAIKLFAKHRGCAACRLGTMTHHPQLTSSRGLSTVPGRVAQGDIWFLESELGRKVPILLAIDEASSFMFIYVFREAALRATGPRFMVNDKDMHAALTMLKAVWDGAVNGLELIKFDREPAIASLAIAIFCKSMGIELVLNAAGHKLGLAEGSVRIVKDKGKSVTAGIPDKFG